MRVTASAPGKAILCGEHACVFGEPAVAMAINLRAKASAKLRKDELVHIVAKDIGASGYFEGKEFKSEVGGMEARLKLEPIQFAVEEVLRSARKVAGINLEVQSDIPIAVGLGSSAAVAVASATAASELLGLKMKKEDICSIAFRSERIVHINPSGIDNIISTYGGAILFRKGTEFLRLRIPVEFPLIVGDTRISRSTGEMVSFVKESKEKYPDVVEPILRSIGQLSERAAKALEKGNLEEFGEFMNINHELLSAIGVSNEFLDRLTHVARKAGALGAKLTGAGGGGCIIALALPDKVNSVMKAIEREGGSPFIVRKDDEGVRCWSEG